MKVNDLIKLIPIFITIIGLLIGTFTWATSQHSDLREKIISGNDTIRQQLKEDIKSNIKELYVPRYEFSVQKEQIKELQKQNNVIIDNISKLDNKIDKMLLNNNCKTYDYN